VAAGDQKGRAGRPAHPRPAAHGGSLWIAVGAGPKEVAARAGHTSVSFTLDRYGHLYPEADTALRDRLDALYVAGRQAGPDMVIELPRDRSRPQRGPATG